MMKETIRNHTIIMTLYVLRMRHTLNDQQGHTVQRNCVDARVFRKRGILLEKKETKRRDEKKVRKHPK